MSMPLKSLGLRLPAIAMRRPGAWRWTKSTTAFTWSGSRSSIAMIVSSYHPFSFRCAAKRWMNGAQRASNSGVPGFSLSFQGQSV